uniref:Adenylate kinase n=1 Tax=Alexandrium monilatum TaxID=311494 RepID=A0A7S4PX53_9DINO
MVDGLLAGCQRCLRAPRGEQDFLSGQQVDRYLSLLRHGELQALNSQALHARAKSVSLAGGGLDRRLEGSDLVEAILASLDEGPTILQQTLASELAPPVALPSVLAAYSAGCNGPPRGGGGISCHELPTFVRFCVAYRLHCYFETSRLQQPFEAVAFAESLQPEVLFMLGGPGAGKSTQCARIARVFGHCHLSVSDLLLAESLRKGFQQPEAGATVGEALAEHIVHLLWSAVQDSGGPGRAYIIEGFPRRTADLVVWDRAVGSRARVGCGLFLAASGSVLSARCRERGGCEAAVAAWAHSLRVEAGGVLDKLSKAGLLRKVPAEGDVEKVWRSIQGILGPRVVFVLGSPGAGKGTQCSRISGAFGYTHLSAGDILREEGRRDSELAKDVREGRLVCSKKLVALLRRKMEEKGWQGGRYVIDGFPRSLANMREWDSSVKGRASIKLCLHLDCSEAISEARLLEYGKISGRSDDNPESIRKRFSTWYHESQPVLQRFKEEGLLQRVDAEQGVEAVWADVRGLFGPSVIFALGGPGAGKGTQCARISETFGYQHLSTGDLLREELLRPHSPVRDLIQDRLREGGLVPDELVLRLVQRALEERGWEGGKYLVDGFPGSADNLTAWNRVLGTKASVRQALFFECPEAIMEARLLERGQRNERDDDTLDAIRKRLEVFRRESMPVVHKFESDGLLRRIDGSRTEEEIWADVKKLFGPSVIFVLGVPNIGKRIQCARISETFGFHHIRMEELLEEECQRPCPGGAEGLLGGPAELEVALLQRAMEERGWEGGRYVIEGFPRSQEGMEAWDRVLAPRVSSKLALLIELGEEAVASPSSGSRSGLSTAVTQESLEAFKAESAPVVRSFNEQGLLRKVWADQDVEVLWKCVQEVLHFELDAQLMNYAVVIVKHKASSPETDRFVQSFLASHGIAVVQSGTMPVDEFWSSGLFDKTYYQLLDYAGGDPSAIPITAAGRERFREATGEEWGEAVARGRVLSAAAALSALGRTAASLGRAWDGDGTEVWRVDQYLSVAWITGENGSGAWVVNGFALQWRNAFVESAQQSNRYVRWFCVEFAPAKVSWSCFRTELLGALDPKEASPDSIRGQFYRHWRTLGIETAPDIFDNCVHASGGPLEGLREWMLLTGDLFHDHPFVRSILSAGVPVEVLEAWLQNPQVEAWHVGQAVLSGPLFACSAESDHATFRASAQRYMRARGGDLKPRSMRRKSTEQAQLRTFSKQGKGKLPAMTLLHFNDVYNVESRKREPVGGIARFVTRMRELKEEASARGEEALCLFSGDAFNPSLTSTVTKGKHMVPALNAVGIHMACYGNHDFDFGVDELVDMASQSNFPWLISNVVDKATGEGLAKGRVTHIMDWYGRKIGLMGLVEREWLVTLHTIEPEDVVFEDFCQCGRRLARQLREEGAELVLALTHMRVPNDELLAQEVEEIDMILGGHDHHYDVKPVGPFGTYVLKSGTDFRDITVLRLRFTNGCGPKAFEVLESKHVEIVSSIAEDSEMKQLVDECQQQVGDAMDEVLGHSAVDLDCRFSAIRTRETNVGNFVTDVMRAGFKTDLAMINSGTLRADAIIQKGPIKVRDLLSILPMLDELCVLELSGAQVLSILQNSVSQYPRLEGRFLQVSGVSFTFDAARPAGERLDEDGVCIGGAPLEVSQRYRVCTLNYLRQGKDGFDALRGAMCIADGEQAGMLPTLVREHLLSISMLNGTTPKALPYRVKRAMSRIDRSQLSPVGEGAEPFQKLGIMPKVDGRIMCLNPVAES